MAKKQKTERVVHTGATLQNISIVVQPESDLATEKRAEAVKALAGAIQANADALSRAADALRGPANETTGIRVEGVK
jgi:hypothetical protein